MPKVELGTFGLVAWEALELDSRSGVLFASWACCVLCGGASPADTLASMADGGRGGAPLLHCLGRAALRPCGPVQVPSVGVRTHSCRGGDWLRLNRHARPPWHRAPEVSGHGGSLRAWPGPARGRSVFCMGGQAALQAIFVSNAKSWASWRDGAPRPAGWSAARGRSARAARQARRFDGAERIGGGGVVWGRYAAPGCSHQIA
jgi:hypothetical protein